MKNIKPKCCSQCINKDGFKRIKTLDVKTHNLFVWECKTCGHLILKKGI
jgi:hypothetical protein